MVASGRFIFTRYATVLAMCHCVCVCVLLVPRFHACSDDCPYNCVSYECTRSLSQVRTLNACSTHITYICGIQFVVQGVMSIRSRAKLCNRHNYT